MPIAPDLRADVVTVARELLRRDLVEGSAGNVSARLADGTVVCTPSGVAYGEMEVGDLVGVDLDGRVLDAPSGRPPTSELALHLACYRAFPAVGAVVHAHPRFATMFAVARQPIPACIDEFSIFVGGDVPVADYAPSGTPELGAVAVAALRQRRAALLSNHGLVAVGRTPADALHVTALVERSAHIVWGAQALGPLHPLPVDVSRKLAAAYGRIEGLTW